jgi:hypothetical protein
MKEPPEVQPLFTEPEPRKNRRQRKILRLREHSRSNRSRMGVPTPPLRQQPRLAFLAEKICRGKILPPEAAARAARPAWRKRFAQCTPSGRPFKEFLGKCEAFCAGGGENPNQLLQSGFVSASDPSGVTPSRPIFVFRLQLQDRQRSKPRQKPRKNR